MGLNFFFCWCEILQIEFSKFCTNNFFVFCLLAHFYRCIFRTKLFKKNTQQTQQKKTSHVQQDVKAEPVKRHFAEHFLLHISSFCFYISLFHTERQNEQQFQWVKILIIHHNATPPDSGWIFSKEWDRSGFIFHFRFIIFFFRSFGKYGSSCVRLVYKLRLVFFIHFYVDCSIYTQKLRLITYCHRYKTKTIGYPINVYINLHLCRCFNIDSFHQI